MQTSYSSEIEVVQDLKNKCHVMSCFRKHSLYENIFVFFVGSLPLRALGMYPYLDRWIGCKVIID